MTCCSEPWCSNGHNWKVCSYQRPGETPEECQHRVNEKAEELKAGPLPPNCQQAAENEPEAIFID